MGYMKRMWMEMLLEPEPDPKDQTILKNVIEECIRDLEKAQMRGVERQHKEVLVWSACRNLKRLKEML